MSETSSGGAPVCILVVDDHPNVAETLARAIAQLGPEVETLSVDGGVEALDLMKRKSVDLLITDLVMPGVTGLELAERMQEMAGSRPAYTILMTAYDVPGLKEIARRLMVNEVIRKPVPAETICRIVVRALEICGYGPIGRASDAERKEMEGGKDPFVGEEPNRGNPSP